jgi:hypothetical protein
LPYFKRLLVVGNGQRLSLLRNLVIKHPEAIAKAQEQGNWYIGGYGLFIKKDFEDAGLIV